MGVHNQTNRSKRLALLPKWGSVPMNWLACPNSGDLVSCPNHPEIIFLPIKTPLPACFFESLNDSVRWTVADAVELGHSKAASLLNLGSTSTNIIAINLSASKETVTQNEWEAIGAKYFRIPIKKDFDVSSIDKFCNSINNEISNKEPTLCFLYSGRGQNRVRFAICSYLIRNCDQEFNNVVKAKDFYNQKALNSLSQMFSGSKLEAVRRPEWLINLQDERSISIGEVPLPLEKYKGVKKISRKEIFGTEADLVKSLLPQELPYVLWDDHSLEEVLSLPFQCTFDARGLKTYLVATKENSVFLVDSRGRVWLLRARVHHSQLPLVASCVLIEEQRRCVVLLTDLFRYGDVVNKESELNERLATLANKVTKKLKTDNNSTYLLQFVYRPMARVRDAIKLKRDLSSLFAKSDGLLFYGNEKVICLPLTPSVVLQFDYNGNDKAFLLAQDTNGELVPVGIYTVYNKKLLGMDRRTSRFEYDANKNEWTAIALGQDDVPSTVDEVKKMKQFNSLNISIDSIMKDLENAGD